MVYFITNTKNIKIGYTNQDVHKRLRQLSTGSDERLLLIGYQKGDKKLEQLLHKRFDNERLRQNGEWFKPSQDLLNYINKINEKPDSFVDVDSDGLVQCYLCITH